MMPLCDSMAVVAKAVAGIGALFYVAYRVWKSLAAAEPIDVFPLLRPIVICLCIMFFSTIVMGTINGVLSPVSKGAASLMETQLFDLENYQQKRDKLEREAMLRDPETAFLISNEEFDKQLDELGWSTKDLCTMTGMYMERMQYKATQNMRQWFKDFLEILFQSASLIIDTLRTFFLIVLTILGPISFALSVFDGFQGTLTFWLSRYICIYLWLPISDIFSSILARIQILMLDRDIAELEANKDFIPDGTNTTYIIFMLIGIIGYITIPTVATWVVQAAGGGAYSRNINTVVMKGGGSAYKGGQTAGKAVSAAGGAVGGYIAGKLLKRK